MKVSGLCNLNQSRYLWQLVSVIENVVLNPRGPRFGISIIVHLKIDRSIICYVLFKFAVHAKRRSMLVFPIYQSDLHVLE